MTLESFLTLQEVARLLKFTPLTVRKMVKDGTLAALRFPGKRCRYRIPQSAITALLTKPAPKDA